MHMPWLGHQLGINSKKPLGRAKFATLNRAKVQGLEGHPKGGCPCFFFLFTSFPISIPHCLSLGTQPLKYAMEKRVLLKEEEFFFAPYFCPVFPSPAPS